MNAARRQESVHLLTDTDDSCIIDGDSGQPSDDMTFPPTHVDDVFRAPHRSVSIDSAADYEYFGLFNARNAKVIAFITLLAVAPYHSLLHLMSIRQDSCIGLLETGRYQGDHIWQPYGCMMHNYSQADSRACFKSHVNRPPAGASVNHLSFVGDDLRMGHLYEHFVRQFDPDLRSMHGTAGGEVYTENEGESIMRLEHHSVEMGKSREILDAIAALPLGKAPVFMLIAGSYSWWNMSEEVDPELGDEYRANVTNLLPALHHIQKRHNTTILWMMHADVDESKTLAPNVTKPYSNRQVGLFNQIADEILSHSPVRVWRSAALLSNGYNVDSEDGVRLGKVALDYDVQVLLNFYCNAISSHGDGTCCGRPEPLTNMQTLAFTMYLLCIALFFVMLLLRVDMTSWLTFLTMQRTPFPVDSKRKSSSATHHTSPLARRRQHHQWHTFHMVAALAKLSAIMMFFYACDRADFFMKENKWFTYFNLFLPIVYLSVLGVFFAEQTQNTEFLPRDQSEEWRGWMQLVILSSQVTGAVEIKWVYMMNRCLLSSYMFLLGYGHFMYFWTTSDFSLTRVARVLFRYNLLVVLLCLTMNRPYQFYSFVPLVSFWYLVVFIVMRMPPCVTANRAGEDENVQARHMRYFLMICKLITLFSCITVLYVSEIFFERISLLGPWRMLFTTNSPHGPVNEWWNKWCKDRYSAPLGMVFALLICVLRENRMLNESGVGPLLPSRSAFGVTSASLVTVAMYVGLIAYCRTLAECDEFHAYVAFAPVIAYLALRNMLATTRSRVSLFFAWFGRIALELFTAKHHIWMVSDSNGVLVLLPRYPVANVLITSFIFICVAHELHNVTVQLVPVLIPRVKSTVDSKGNGLDDENGAHHVGSKRASLFTLLAAICIVVCVYVTATAWNQQSLKYSEGGRGFGIDDQ